MNKTIIITGGAGFIGSHVVRLFVDKYPDYRIINVDKLTYAGNLANLKDVEDRPNYRFVRHLRFRGHAHPDGGGARGRNHPSGCREPCGQEHQGSVHIRQDECPGYSVAAPGREGILGISS